MRKTLILIILLIGLLSQTAHAAARLTVVITVDGLTESNLQRMRSYWPQGGLRTLSEESYQTTIDYPHWIYGGAESVATLMTGLTPLQSGYAMDTYFSRSDRRAHRLLEDTNEKGIGTPMGLSARNLLGTTITDEHRMNYGDRALIYAIGIVPEKTMLMAGHAANACCWLDAQTQRWVSTSYYDEGLPSAADDMNVGERMGELLTRTWVPRMDIATYMSPTPEEKKRGFSYLNSKYLHHTPMANTLVVELALALQKSKHLGEDTTPDLLMLQMHTTTPASASDQIRTAEQEDLYLWLNQDLGYLIEQLTKRIGKQNLEILLVGTPSRGMSADMLRSAGFTIQHFNVDRAAALIGTYLMALYGHERWVDGGYGNTIFLNRTLIEQKRLSLETIQRQVANFLMEFEGINLALPAHEAIVHPDMCTSISKRTMGDVVFCLEPNWVLMADDRTPLDHVIDTHPISPVMLWTGSVRQWPEHTLQATDIKSLLH